MERLTFTDLELEMNGVDCVVKDVDETFEWFCDKVCDEFQYDCPFDKLGRKLKAYEDTGLTPEQILAMDEEYTKLAKELWEYKRLEEQGRLIELKPIKGFEHLYAVDMFGDVYGIAKENKNGRRVLKRKATKNKQNGYMYIALKDNGNIKNARVHRLVAEAFIPNPNNYPSVNHIDGNKENNCIWNLEWCTNGDNSKHAVKNGLLKPPTNNVDGIYKNGKNKYAVTKNMRTGEVRMFTNLREACEYLERGHCYIWQQLSKGKTCFCSREIKVAVFLTKAEAEKALEEMGE